MADPTMIPPFDSSDTGAWLDVQRKQQMASMLMGALQSSLSAPSPQAAPVGPYQVQAKRGALQNIAPILTAALAGKANRDAMQAQTNFYNPPQPAQAAPYDPAAAAQTAQAAPGLVAPPPSQGSPTNTPTVRPAKGNPNVPPGVDPALARNMYYRLGPEKYGEWLEKFITPTDAELTGQRAGLSQQEAAAQKFSHDNDPETLRLARIAGIPDAQAAKAQFIKSTTQDLKPGQGYQDLQGNWHVAPDVGKGEQYQTLPDGTIQAVPIQNSDTIQAGRAGMVTGAQQRNTPIELGVDANGQKVFGYPSTPPSLRGNPSVAGASGGGSGGGRAGGGVTVNQAATTAQTKGAEAGQEYSTELSKNATGATEVRRSLSELRNLAAQANPAATNDAKSKIGAMMIAAGSDPETVSKYLGVDTGALQAAQKQTATLAVNTIHSMTSRGTNFDLDTFMRNNPNLNLSDPGAFNRVADYMDGKAQQEIAKQKDFVGWKKGVPADEWESGHTAHWLEKQNADIDAGRSNSRRPAPPGTDLATLEAEKARRAALQNSYGARSGSW